MRSTVSIFSPYSTCSPTFSVLWKKVSQRCLPLSVHAGLCQPVVHDAKCSHPSRESVLTGSGAGLARMPDGHLGKLLLHDGQVYLRAERRKRRETKRDEAVGQTRRRSLAVRGKSVSQSAGVARIWFYRCDTRLAGGVFPSPEVFSVRLN